MNNFITIPVDEGISFKIPATWVKEVGDPGEYAFISGDGSIFLTVAFIRFNQSDTTLLETILEQATEGVKEIANFTSPILDTPYTVARHIEMGALSMLFAMKEGILQEDRIIANLFFKTEDAAIFETNRALMEEMIQAVEIKG